MSRQDVENKLSSTLKIKSRNGDRWMCTCPLHDDNKASLGATFGRDKALINCLAGCDNKAVLAYYGLTYSDLYYEHEKPLHNKVEPWIIYLEKSTGNKVVERYDYYRVDNGEYCYSKIRLVDKNGEKHFVYGIFDGNGRIKTGKGIVKRDEIIGVYGDIKAVRQSQQVFIVEGGKDVDTMVSKGYPNTFTYGSSNEWNKQMSELCKDKDVVVLADNDTAGAKVSNEIKTDLTGTAKTVRVLTPCPDVPKADISDYFINHDKIDFENLISENGANKDVTQDVGETVETATDLKSQYVKWFVDNKAYDNYNRDDIGSSELLADILKDRHRFNATANEWAEYTDNGTWKPDTGNLAVESTTKIVAKAFVTYANYFDDEHYIKYAITWRSKNERPKLIKDCRDIHRFKREMLDTDPLLFNTQDCVIKLELDGTYKTIEHNPNMMLSQCANVTYNKGAKCGTWLKFFDEIMQGNEADKNYIQKLLGYSLSGLVKDECFWLFYGSSTRNGKTTLTETILKLMGDYGYSMPPSVFAVKEHNDSRQANPEMANLAGKRYVVMSEPDKKMLLDNAQIKNTTGGNSITARQLYQNPFTFKPQCKLIFDTNYLPITNDVSIFESDRAVVVPFSRHFSESERDTTLKARLCRPQELSGLLNWLLEGWKMYCSEGLTRTEHILTATQEYRDQSDKMQSFINDCLEPCKGVNISVKDAYEAYSKWCEDSGLRTEGKSTFTSDLKQKKIYKPSGTIKQKTVRNVIANYKFKEDNDVTIKSDEVREEPKPQPQEETEPIYDEFMQITQKDIDETQGFIEPEPPQDEVDEWLADSPFQ